MTRAFRQATEEQLHAGLNWYADVHQTAIAIAIESRSTLQAVCGVMAAVSPRLSWPQNLRLARSICNGEADRGYLEMGLTKARDILAGADPMERLGGMKTRNFYASIYTAGEHGVVIDRHAFDVARGVRHEREEDRPGIGRGRYGQAATAYVRATDILSREFGPLTPAQVQAVTWESWRERHNVSAA